MTEVAEVRGWRAMSPRLWQAIGLSIAANVAWTIYAAYHDPFDRDASWPLLVFDGGRIAADVLLCAGLLELADRLTGRRAIFVRIAGFGVAARIVVELAWSYVVTELGPEHFETVAMAGQWMWAVEQAVPLIALIVATWREHEVRGLVCALAIPLVVPVPVVAKALYGWLAPDLTAMQMLEGTIHAARLAIIGVLAAALASGRGSSDVARAATGLRGIAYGLRLRIIAALATAIITVSFAGAVGHSKDVLKLAMFASTGVGAIAQLVVALGMLRSARAAPAGLPSWVLGLAAVLSLWCAGALVQQIYFVWQVLYEDDHGLYAGLASGLPVALPVAATLALALVAYAIAAFGERSANAELQHHASTKGVGFAVLMFASLAVTGWLLPNARSDHDVLGMALCAAIAAIAAQEMMARLCVRGSDALGRDPSLPPAQLVR
jgi:hypothetical protein